VLSRARWVVLGGGPLAHARGPWCGGAEDGGGGLALAFADGGGGEAAEEGGRGVEAGLGQEEVGAVAGQAEEGVVLVAGGGVGREAEEGLEGDVLDAGDDAWGVVGSEELVEEEVGAGGRGPRRGLGGLERAVGEGVRGTVQIVHGTPLWARGFSRGPSIRRGKMARLRARRGHIGARGPVTTLA